MLNGRGTHLALDPLYSRYCFIYGASIYTSIVTMTKVAYCLISLSQFLVVIFFYLKMLPIQSKYWLKVF